MHQQSMVPVTMKTLDSTGVQQLLDGAQGTMSFPLIHLATFTGMRRSVLLGLRWKYVDLVEGTGSTSQVLYCLPGCQIGFEQPKTAKSKRLLNFSAEAVLVLRVYEKSVEADRHQMETPINAPTGREFEDSG